jgi:hypothetical protein
MWFSWTNACDFHELMHAMWFSWILVVARSCCFIARSCCFRSCQTKTTPGYLIHRYRTKTWETISSTMCKSVSLLELSTMCKSVSLLELAWIRMASLNLPPENSCFQLVNCKIDWLMCCKQCIWTSCSCGVIWCGWCNRNRLHVT